LTVPGIEKLVADLVGIGAHDRGGGPHSLLGLVGVAARLPFPGLQACQQFARVPAERHQLPQSVARRFIDAEQHPAVLLGRPRLVQLREDPLEWAR
jgi:hypothetical protein